MVTEAWTVKGSLPQCGPGLFHNKIRLPFEEWPFQKQRCLHQFHLFAGLRDRSPQGHSHPHLVFRSRLLNGSTNDQQLVVGKVQKTTAF